MKLYKLSELKDQYLTIYSTIKKPQLYLIVPINRYYGIAVWIKDLNGH